MISLLLAVIVFLGFAPTFYLRPFLPPPPMFTDEFFTVWLYIHGLLLTAWFILLIVQSALVNVGRVALHRRLGILGMGIAIAAAASVVPVLLLAPSRFVSAGMPVEQVLPFVTTLIWFDIFNLGAFLIMIGWAWRRCRDGAFHKRLVIIASISLMPPALFRALFFVPGAPGLPTAMGIVALLIVSVAVWDLIRLKRLHPATMWAAAITLAGYVLGSLAAMTEPARAFVEGLV